ncbi:hypothetical protein EHS13_31845 [Paenibacillus psychroresistens]|uniref:DUF4386 family protein n=1 Tax=Paenibacillus psychroresistens TaxID=1778678 RepID=A0A6B8RTL9_9BACL|nr:hypothetical protein [Paenibacillus psychroresistens]QGQ99144.1 hypothetical protein EHS13_31845 [Paenibacillus psychroresistens]
MKITASNLNRFTGLSLIVAGILYAIIQPLHPEEIISSVTTSLWAIVHIMSVAMACLGLIGFTGIYIRQMEKLGLLGLVGFLMLSIWMFLVMVFTFAEAFIMPILAPDVPKFVVGFINMFGEGGSEVSLGALAIFVPVGGVTYLLGALLFSIAIFRAGTLPRLAVILFALGAVSAIPAGLISHELARYTAVLVGLAMAWFGYAHWSELREKD